MKHGGRRPGGGRKPGQARLDKEQAREIVRQLVYKSLHPLVQAQLANATGLSYLVYRDKKTGKFERVKDIDAVDQNAETIEVWEKDPNVQAFTDLMNRALDKPKEQEMEIVLTNEASKIAALHAGRTRAAQRAFEALGGVKALPEARG